jgi:hypothetical protein
VLKRQATYYDQKIDALTAALPRMSTQAGVDKLNAQIQALQQRRDALDLKMTELSKPVNLAAGGALVSPVDGSTVAERDPKTKMLSPEEYKQQVDLSRDKANASATARLEATKAAGGAELSDGAIEMAAERYLLTGEMPSVGYGSQGFVQRAKVLNKASELALAQGDDAQATALRQSANKNTIAANRQMRAQEEKLGAFEKTAVKNADLALKASEELDRLGVPFLDKVFINAEKNVSDNPAIARLQLYTLGFRNEYARIVTGATGVTSDTARAEVDSVLRAYMGKMSFKAAIEAAKQEMTNRMEGFREQNAAAMDELRGGRAPAAGGSGAADAPAQGEKPKTVNWTDL